MDMWPITLASVIFLGERVLAAVFCSIKKTVFHAFSTPYSKLRLYQLWIRKKALIIYLSYDIQLAFLSCVRHSTIQFKTFALFEASWQYPRWNKGALCANRKGICTSASEINREALSSKRIWLLWKCFAQHSEKTKTYMFATRGHYWFPHCSCQGRNCSSIYFSKTMIRWGPVPHLSPFSGSLLYCRKLDKCSATFRK